MADPVVSVAPTRVVVEPGGQVPVTVTVGNTGHLVEGFRLTVHGAAAGWAEVVATGETEAGQSDVVRVYPGKEATATVVFSSPPVSAGLTGEVPFCVLAQSVVDPSSSAAAEGDLEIGRVDGLSASMTPVTSTGRWSGRHTVKVSNWGNAPASLRLTASDPDEALGFLVHPEHLQLPVGASAVAAVRVRSRRPFLRGTAVRLPFRVVAEPDPVPGNSRTARPPATPPVVPPAVSDPGRPVLDGALNQKPVLSRATVALAALAVMGMAAGVVALATADPAPAAEQELDTAVPVPQGLRAVAAGDTAVVLGWEGLPRQVDSIKIFQVKPGTEAQLLPVTQEEIEVSGELLEQTVDELEPATPYCFQIAAVRGEGRSPRSAAACATTEAPPPVATPATGSTAGSSPADGSPAAGEGSGSSGSSAPASGSSSPTADSASAVPGVPAPGNPATTTTSPPPGPTPTTDARSRDFAEDWVLVRPFPADAAGEQLAGEREARLAALVAESGRTDLQVGRLDSPSYPALPFTRPSVVVWVGPFATQQEASAACPELGFDPSTCHPQQPGTPR